MSSYVETIRKLIGSRPLFVPGVRAIILNDHDEILLQHRTDTRLWGLPSGAVEPGESALEALKREVFEETSLRITRAEPIALHTGRSQAFAYPNGDQVQCFAVAFVIREWEGSPQADGVEGSDVRFFSLNSLPQNLVRIHEETIRDYAGYQGRFLVS